MGRRMLQSESREVGGLLPQMADEPFGVLPRDVSGRLVFWRCRQEDVAGLEDRFGGKTLRIFLVKAAAFR